MSDPQASPKTGALPTTTILQGRYLIQRRLGQGGMGAVYLAHDQRLEVDTAIKEMSTALLKTDEERERSRRQFHEEAKLLARLSHTNLPRVTDHFTEDGKEYLVMEYVPGDTLSQMLRRTAPPWALKDVLAIAEPLTDVLHYLHSRTPPIIFRDLKPSNVMRTPEGEVKLIDFGIARLFKPGQSQDTQAFGTMGYSAPEQYGVGQTDARSDVYALSILLHQLITGYDPVAQPFGIPPAIKLNPQVPEPLSVVLQTAMSHDPTDRFDSMPAFKRAFLSSATTTSRTPYIASPQYGANQANPMYNPAATPQRGYNPPTPQQPYAAPTPQQGFNQPTPQQPYATPTPQQPYAAPTPQQPYTPQAGYGPAPQQPYMPANYHPSTQSAAYNQQASQQYVAPTPQGGYGPQAPMSPYVTPYSPMNPPRAHTTGIARATRWTGFLAFGSALIALIAPPEDESIIATLIVLGSLLGVLGFIFGIIALVGERTALSLKGRSHAGWGLALALVAIMVACAALGRVSSYYNN